MKKFRISIANNNIHDNDDYRGSTKDDMNNCLGQLLDIAVKNKELNSINIKSFYHWVKPAILHNQFLCLKNTNEVYYSGYISWAWVDGNTLARYMNDTRFNISPSEWNEGSNLIIIDFLMNEKFIFSVRGLIKKVFKYELISEIYFCKRNADGEVITSRVITK